VTTTPERDRINWVDGNVTTGVRYCLLNGVSGEGVDIFCAFSIAKSPGEFLLYADQRKRVASATAARDLIRKEAIIPACLGEGAAYVLGLFSLLATFDEGPDALLEDSFVLSYAQHNSFHGCLASHPSCSPAVDVNYCNISTLKLLLSVKHIASDIIEERGRQPFTDLQTFKNFCIQRGTTALSAADALRCIVY
jgi:hypothetical protein